MKKELIELDSILTELEIMQEKAKIICEDLENEYYGRNSKYIDSKYIECYKERAAIKNEIVFDYLYQMENKIQKLKALIED